jgi:hypothetical protein
MSATIEILGLDPLTNRVKTWPRAIDNAVHEQILVEARPLTSTMHGLASGVGGVARHAARNLRVVSTTDGVSVTASGDPTIFGAEFGSHRKRRKAYVNRSRRGDGYIVRRRTTMQFKPHLGRRGYWFWPAVRTDLAGINRRVLELLSDVVGAS